MKSASLSRFVALRVLNSFSWFSKTTKRLNRQDMKLNERILPVLGMCAAFTFSGINTKAATFGYTLDVTTFYQDGAPPSVINGITGSPDTGFFTVMNNGTTTFTGTIGDIAHAGNGTDFSFTSSSLTLAPGASATFGVNDEGSNQGGYNGPTGTTQPGVTIQIDGLINGAEGIVLSVNDADIHSGVSRVNPFGVTVDSYVLQGGDPLGRDTGDAFETTQANGHFEFFEAGPGTVPEVSSTLSLLGMALTGLFGLRRFAKS